MLATQSSHCLSKHISERIPIGDKYVLAQKVTTCIPTISVVTIVDDNPGFWMVGRHRMWTTRELTVLVEEIRNMDVRIFGSRISRLFNARRISPAPLYLF